MTTRSRRSRIGERSHANHTTLSPLTIDTHQVHYNDLLGAVSYLLRQEIAAKASISDDQLGVLRRLMKLLSANAPLRPPVRRLLYRLSEFVDSVIAPLDGGAWRAKVDQLNEELGRPLPMNTTYGVCQTYPCALWSLMHTLTVQARMSKRKICCDVLICPFQQLASTRSPRRGPSTTIWSRSSAARRVLNICARMRVTIWVRFTACNPTVTAPADTLPPNDANAAILWLWRSHNRANAMLHSEATSIEVQLRKKQFPSALLCAACRKNVNTVVVDTTFDRDKWDELAVVEFLKRFYGRVDVPDGDSVAYRVSSFNDADRPGRQEARLPLDDGRKLDADDIVDSERRRRKDATGGMDWTQAERRFGDSLGGRLWSWSTIDWSLCISVWTVCMIVVVLLCVLFNYRRTRGRLCKRYWGGDSFKV